MKNVLIVVSFILQIFAVSLSSKEFSALVISVACLAVAEVLASVVILKFKSKLGFLPFLTGTYFLIFYLYYLVAGMG